MVQVHSEALRFHPVVYQVDYAIQRTEINQVSLLLPIALIYVQYGFQFLYREPSALLQRLGRCLVDGPPVIRRRHLDAADHGYRPLLRLDLKD